MMLTLKHGMILILLLFIGACTSEENDEADNQQNQSESQSNLLKDQLKAIDKAKNVEKVIQDATEKRLQSVDQ